MPSPVLGRNRRLASTCEPCVAATVFLERYGRPAAVLGSPERYEELIEALEDADDGRAFDAPVAEEDPDIPWTEVTADLGRTRRSTASSCAPLQPRRSGTSTRKLPPHPRLHRTACRRPDPAGNPTPARPPDDRVCVGDRFVVCPPTSTRVRALDVRTFGRMGQRCGRPCPGRVAIQRSDADDMDEIAESGEVVGISGVEREAVGVRGGGDEEVGETPSM